MVSEHPPQFSGQWRNHRADRAGSRLLYQVEVYVPHIDIALDFV